MSRFVVLLDFSKYSQTLIDFGFVWKDMFGCELVFVHQVPGNLPTLTDHNSKKQILEIEKKQASSLFFDLVKSRGKQPDAVEFIATEKQLNHYLMSFLKADDILFLGIKGTGFLKQILIGSTAIEIINELNHLTLAIPPEIHSARPEHVIIGLHHRYPVNIPEIKRILKLFGNKVKQVDLISVINGVEERKLSEEYLDVLKEELGGNLMPTVKIFEGTDTFSKIKSYVIKRPNTYFMVQKGSRTLNDQLFRRFLINDLILDGNIPLIILPS